MRQTDPAFFHQLCEDGFEYPEEVKIIMKSLAALERHHSPETYLRSFIVCHLRRCEKPGMSFTEACDSDPELGINVANDCVKELRDMIRTVQSDRDLVRRFTGDARLPGWSQYFENIHTKKVNHKTEDPLLGFLRMFADNLKQPKEGEYWVFQLLPFIAYFIAHCFPNCRNVSRAAVCASFCFVPRPDPAAPPAAPRLPRRDELRRRGFGQLPRGLQQAAGAPLPVQAERIGGVRADALRRRVDALRM